MTRNENRVITYHICATRLDALDPASPSISAATSFRAFQLYVIFSSFLRTANDDQTCFDFVIYPLTTTFHSQHAEVP